MFHDCAVATNRKFEVLGGFLSTERCPSLCGAGNELSIMAGVILNDLLCYLTSARNTLTRDTIVQNSVAFFTKDSIVRA